MKKLRVVSLWVLILVLGMIGTVAADGNGRFVAHLSGDGVTSVNFVIRY